MMDLDTNTIFKKITSKWIALLNLKTKTAKISRRKTLCNLERGKYFLLKTQEAHATKGNR
jgi:hypothetical protein